MKILGTIMNDNLDWSDQHKELATQLYRRKSAVIRITKRMGFKFSKNIANSIIISKLNYHLEIWGSSTKNHLNNINKILFNLSRNINPESYGRTDNWCMKKMNWVTIEKKIQ